MPRPILLPLVVAAGLAGFWATHADAGVRVQAGVWGWPGATPGTAFDLHFAREDLAMEYEDGSTGDVLEITSIGISFHESLGAGLRGAARIGAVEVVQDDRDVTEGLDLTGFYLEVGFDGAWPAESRLRVGVDSAWRYTRVNRKRDDDNEVRLDWHSWELRSDIRLLFTSRVQLRMGAGVIGLDGNERVRGPDSASVGVEADDAVAAHAQLDFHTGPGGVIRLRLRGGNPEGAWISFEHNY